METPIREIASSDGECFDEQVEEAIAMRNRQTGTHSKPANRRQVSPSPAAGVPQGYHQNAPYSEGNLHFRYDDLEAKLADIVQTHLAYSQQVHNTVQSIVFEVMEQKDQRIAQLQAETQRLQHQHSFNSGVGGHNSGGTGDSGGTGGYPYGSYSTPVKKVKEAHVTFAWNTDQHSNSLRNAAREVKTAEFPMPPAGAGMVGIPQHDPPKMQRPTTADTSAVSLLRPTTADTSTVSMLRPTTADTSVVSSPSVRFNHAKVSSVALIRNSGASRSSAMLGSRLSTADVNKRVSVLNTNQQARLAAKEARAMGAIKDDDKKDGKKNEAVFIDANAMKEKVKQAVMRPEYNVANFYHTKGCWQFLARHTYFDNITLAIIAFNAIWISVDTDMNKAATLIIADPVFVVAENTFCFYFTIELMIRFMAFRNKRDCLRDAWFMFDSCLVVMMVMETWVMSAVLILTDSGGGAGMGDASILRLVRLLRLTRMARMARLLRAMPELMILIKGISVATRSVFFTLCLLTIIIYVFAVAFAQLAEKTPLEGLYFKTVPDAMQNLLLLGVLPDLSDFVTGVGKENVLYGVLLLFFILLSSLTVMNMLVGVLVEVVSVVSSVEKEQMTVQFVKSMIQSMLEDSGIDANQDKQISRPEFESLLLKPEAARIIQEVGVDVVGLVDFADFIFKDDENLSFPEFMEIVLQLRGNNTATVRDIVDLRKFVLTEMTEIHSAVSSISINVSEKLEDAMTNVSKQSETIVKNMQSISEASNAPPIQHQMPDTMMADAARPGTGVQGGLGARYRGAKNINNAAANELQNKPSNRVGRSLSPGSSRPASGMSSLSRPMSGMGPGFARPWSGVSGVSNPQPLPAFPDHMFVTELEDVAQNSNMQEGHQRRALSPGPPRGRVQQVKQF